MFQSKWIAINKRFYKFAWGIIIGYNIYAKPILIQSPNLNKREDQQEKSPVNLLKFSCRFFFSWCSCQLFASACLIVSNAHIIYFMCQILHIIKDNGYNLSIINWLTFLEADRWIIFFVTTFNFRTFSLYFFYQLLVFLSQSEVWRICFMKLQVSDSFYFNTFDICMMNVCIFHFKCASHAHNISAKYKPTIANGI